MKKQTKTKIISGLIIFAFLLPIIVSPLKTTAATNSSMSSLYANPNQNNAKNPYKFKVSDVVNSNLLTHVVGCTGVVNKVATWMARFQSSPLNMKKKADALREQTLKQTKDACASIKAGVKLSQGLLPNVTITPATDTAAEKWCAENVESRDDKQIQLAIEDQEARQAQTIKDQCFDGIAITLAKNQLTSMTRSAVNWVNSGYGGNPFFVQNMTNLTNNIEKNVLETGIDILLSPENESPYARDFARSTIRGYSSGVGTGSSSLNFLSNLSSDLGAFITDPKSYYTDDQLWQAYDTRTALQRAQDANNTFANDFSSGGWDAYLALTQKPQNNPLGFTMLASQKLSDTQSQQISDTKDELAQNNGFLNQKTCVEWQLFDDTGKPLKKNTQTLGAINNVGGNIVLSKTKSNSGYDKCWTWKTITPGSIIKEKTTSYLNSPERQLELADTINESLNALFSILISKLESGGLSGLSDSVVNTNWTDSMNTIETGYDSDPYDNNGAYNGFNLTRDLGNTYIHDEVYKAGTWNANSRINLTDKNERMSIGYVPPVYADAEKINTISSNVYWTVTGPGNTKIIENGYNGWEVGDRAFWDGSEWQNWKCGPLNAQGGCTNQISPIKNRGVIQIQKDYIVAAKEILKVLPNVMPKLGELDYCIPGPNPSYKTNSTDAQSTYQDWVGSLYVGPIDENRSVFTIDHAGQRTYDNLINIYKDNPSVWKKILGGMQWLLTNFDGYHYLSGKWFSGDNEDKEDLDRHSYWAEINLDYTNSSLFQNFYEVFDKMMDKLYFKNMTSKYLEYENKSLNINTDENPAYIPMSESGLALTRNIQYYNEDITEVMDGYTEAINQAKINISKLEPIKAEVSKIIKAAQDRRDANLLLQINKINQIAIDNCKAEQVLCDNETENVAQCLVEYNLCIDKAVENGGILTAAQYKTKYAGCLDEENIQFYDPDELTNGGSAEGERCFNRIDDDLDRLIDSKDPDCKDATSTTTTVEAHCETNTLNYTTSRVHYGSSDISCQSQDLTSKSAGKTEQQRRSDCESYDYYRPNNGIDESPDPYIIYTCNWIPRS